ncbi:GerAB/ArcD/ProY family transporter [Filobacillus milosensis]|nr:endospore germination permease [Filobacillus milosensis]
MKNNLLSLNQFFFIIIQTQIGIGVISLPYDLHQVSKQNGWISLIISIFLIQIIILIFWLMYNRFPTLNLYDMQMIIYGKWIGQSINFLYVLYFVFVGSLILILFSNLINLWVLPHTPYWVNMLFLLLSCVYLSSSHITVIGRIYTFLSTFFIILFVLLLNAIPELKIYYLFPIAKEGIMPILKGVNQSVLALLGFVVILFVLPVVKGTAKQKLKTMSGAIWFVGFFYLFVVFISFTFFSTEEIKVVPQPVLYLLKSFEFAVVSRIDLLFLTIWIMSVATSFSTFLYLASLGTMQLFKSKKRTKFVWVNATLIFLLVIVIDSKLITIQTYAKYVSNSGYIFSIALPILLYLVMLLLKKRHKEGHSS